LIRITGKLCAGIGRVSARSVVDAGGFPRDYRRMQADLAAPLQSPPPSAARSREGGVAGVRDFLEAAARPAYGPGLDRAGRAACRVGQVRLAGVGSLVAFEAVAGGAR
jgi:hypothetical protein